jgi:uncharacterized protein YfaS (alpha-2-macroglobulin family)
MGSSARATAMTLAAYLEIAPEDELVQPLLRGLDGARDIAGRWGSTQDNLWALIAFADYARRASAGTTTVTVMSGRRTLGTETLTGGAAAIVRVPLTAIEGGELAVKASGPVHYRARVTEVTRDGGAAVASGFVVKREYLGSDGKAKTTFRAGELVKVQLTVATLTSRRWVAMVDPLPAGFEAVNPKLASGGGARGGSPLPWNWAHQELKDDQVRWFADWMSAGTTVMTYQVRATIDGSFLAGPTTIEAMYEPATMGRSAATLVTVSP